MLKTLYIQEVEEEEILLGSMQREQTCIFTAIVTQKDVLQLQTLEQCPYGRYVV